VERHQIDLDPVLALATDLVPLPLLVEQDSFVLNYVHGVFSHQNNFVFHQNNFVYFALAFYIVKLENISGLP
jgi:hypothetical protein